MFTVTSEDKNPGSRPRVVIIGGGFGGLALAKSLKNAPVDILLLDKHNYHTFQPLLYQVAIGSIEADSIGFPIRRIFTKHENFSFNLAEVQKINPETNCIITDIGTIHYDYLVIATGSNTNFFGNKEIEHFAMPMKNIPEALNIRSLVLQNLEQALVTTDMREKSALMTFVVVGGGPTGVELSGALAEMRHLILAKDYHGLSKYDMRVYLVEGKDRLLAAMSPQASAAAKKFLAEGEVMIFNSAHVQSYDGFFLTIDNGKTIKTRNVLWAAGVKGEAPDGLPAEVTGKGSRIQTDEINRVKGYQNIFAIGDVSAVITPDTPNGHPGVAPVAIQQGQQLGKNIARLIKGEPTLPFRYKDKGTLATIGRNKAVADLGKLHFQGFFAWLLWGFVHLMSLAGFSNKGIIFISWVINYFNKNSDNRLIIRSFNTDTRRSNEAHK
ncbi:NAD(P)/FAD-dependent oxidoreductase [Mucilaginibacter sp. L3T2-6]|uniref:NAD(P)/FAD-dependent oxidoreductase n=1 Tax=Mucilaginibacter sp. L3T2-6 TaxID=3062491 RepID=UPI002674BCF2|nr:NAD(P)/FAD-dependent oxidoreductase [Mucilaginibacter sp. L3T2-6]MDO3643371.1 NAD(P)/FAD-dependent oxidoreductase [Mucilaginibacter sp. L3T2-6]MDV6215696.1 NAD(P)/FAD-dependent oxidoreductase [Mucilaginibacter sp. L3T2-6]